MFFRLVVLLLLTIFTSFTTSDDPAFIFNGFKHAEDVNLVRLDGIASITPNGLLRLTNHTVQRKGYAFFFNPLQFKKTEPSGSNTTNATTSVLSFSTTFVFEIRTKKHGYGGQGIAFFIAPLKGFPGALASQFLGLFNDTSNGDDANHVVAVELDTIYNEEFRDINNNHVGIDINGLKSVRSAPASYFDSETGRYKNLSLSSGKSMQVWVEYDGAKKQLDVTLAPIHVSKPSIPLLSLSRDLSPIIMDFMYVGFSSSVGSYMTSHYILGWSFRINGQAPPLDISQLPKLPKKQKFLTIGIPIIATVIALATITGIILYMIRERKLADLVIEDWEHMYRSHRFSYKHLYKATKGFREKELVGTGGFGRVYRGVLPASKIKVAVKRVSHDSRQGMKEFVAEIVSIGQLQHRNLVKLLGYCRRKGELLLVYEFMSNGSLDNFLFGPSNDTSKLLSWDQRFRIIKGVASGLLYLHEECEQVVIHRDIKASNVLLDGEMSAKLSDFGLARLYDHGSNPETTHVAGTLGYLAPEMFRTRKPTRSTDVFGFGAFLLEVACGRRPMEPKSTETDEDLILFDWVFTCWRKGSILETTDPKLGSEFVIEEMELVLKLGLLCSHTLPESRPSMKQVVQYLEGDALLPASELWDLTVTIGLSTNLEHPRGESLLEDFSSTYPSGV